MMCQGQSQTPNTMCTLGPTLIYQKNQNDGQRLKGKARASKTEDSPLRVRRKSGNRIRSDRRVVLHQKIELDYLITIKIFPSLALKNNKTVM